MSFRNVGGLRYTEKNNLAQNKYLAVEINTLLGRITKFPGVASTVEDNYYQGINTFNNAVIFKGSTAPESEIALDYNDNSNKLATTAWVNDKLDVLLQWSGPDNP